MDERQRLKETYSLTDDQLDSLVYIFNRRNIGPMTLDELLAVITHDRKEMDLLLEKFGLYLTAAEKE